MDAVLSQDERVAVARLHALLELLPTALDQHLAPAGLTSFEFTLLEALAKCDQCRVEAFDVPDGADQPLAVEGLNKTFTGLDRVRHGLLDQRVHACLGEGEADLFMKLCGHYDHGGIDAVGDQLLN